MLGYSFISSNQSPSCRNEAGSNGLLTMTEKKRTKATRYDDTNTQSSYLARLYSLQHQLTALDRVSRFHSSISVRFNCLGEGEKLDPSQGCWTLALNSQRSDVGIRSLAAENNAVTVA
ncbi:hypothetical protein OIU78_008252 [Salix suchowensis]|nr:hypothetical protein OIU78_008252 [Salix suchowensis]